MCPFLLERIMNRLDGLSSLIDTSHEHLPRQPRLHLGASVLGHQCARYIWLSFRWAISEQFPGRILRLFRRGQNEEATVIADLELAGCAVSQGEFGQYRVDLGCHISGSLDGIIECGVPGYPDQRHVLEIKTHGKSSFDDLNRYGVKQSKPLHYAQMQVYMLATGIRQALYFAVCKNDDSIYVERVEFNREEADAYISRAKSIAVSDNLPSPMSSDPTWYKCKICSAHDFCFGSRTATQVNCRTCALSTARPDSTWHCTRWDAVIPNDVNVQLNGCPAHVLHPHLVPFEQHPSALANHAVYEIDGKLVTNGEQGVSSKAIIESVALARQLGASIEVLGNA